MTATLRKQHERQALADLIKSRLMGVLPDDQDLVLEDSDWALIIGSLEDSADRMDYGKPGDPSGCYMPKEWRK